MIAFAFVLALMTGALQYTAQAGTLPLHDGATGTISANVFYVAYRVPSAVPRPVTFLWNGGPGANSAPLQFEAFGPRRIAQQRLVDNPETLLSTTDLVFVDAVGTGFSRATAPAYEQRYYSTLGDIDAATQFVEAWRRAFRSEDAPLFLAGESYGAWRAAGAAEHLERDGVRVSGIVLISGGAGVGNMLSQPLVTAFQIPNRAAAALYYGKLSPDLGTDRDAIVASATHWAEFTYAPALEHVASLDSMKREQTARDLSRYTGIPAGEIGPSLSMSQLQYRRELLGDGKVLQALDMRETGPSPLDDASRMEPLITSYYRDELGYKTNLRYTGFDTAPIGERWDYNSGPIAPDAIAIARAGGGPPGAQPWALNAIALDARLRVFVAAGIYDSLNSCAANAYIAHQLPPPVAAHFTMKCYAGGHMMYRDVPALHALRSDLTAFIAIASSANDRAAARARDYQPRRCGR